MRCSAVSRGGEARVVPSGSYAFMIHDRVHIFQVVLCLVQRWWWLLSFPMRVSWSWYRTAIPSTIMIIVTIVIITIAIINHQPSTTNIPIINNIKNNNNNTKNAQLNKTKRSEKWSPKRESRKHIEQEGKTDSVTVSTNVSTRMRAVYNLVHANPKCVIASERLFQSAISSGAIHTVENTTFQNRFMHGYPLVINRQLVIRALGRKHFPSNISVRFTRLSPAAQNKAFHNPGAYPSNR